MADSRKVVKLEGKTLPRNKAGDPEFLQLGEFLKPEERNPKGDLVPPTVLDLFTPEEVVTLVNRQLYAMEYQRKVHRQRAQDERDKWAPIKAIYKEKFGGSFAKATEKEIVECMEELKRRMEAQGE